MNKVRYNLSIEESLVRRALQTLSKCSDGSDELFWKSVSILRLSRADLYKLIRTYKRSYALENDELLITLIDNQLESIRKSHNVIAKLMSLCEYFPIKKEFIKSKILDKSYFSETSHLHLHLVELQRVLELTEEETILLAKIAATWCCKFDIQYFYDLSIENPSARCEIFKVLSKRDYTSSGDSYPSRARDTFVKMLKFLTQPAPISEENFWQCIASWQFD